MHARINQTSFGFCHGEIIVRSRLELVVSLVCCPLLFALRDWDWRYSDELMPLNG